jgi:hypothetical protein
VSHGYRRGQCRCGALPFAVSGEPLVTFACHCTGCQRMTGGAFALSSLYPADRFELLGGEPVRGGLKSGPRHMFCGSCMSWLYTVPEGMDEFVNVRSTMFDHASEHVPFADMWLSEAVPGAESGAARRYETAPDDKEFPQMIADYAAWRNDGSSG